MALSEQLKTSASSDIQLTDAGFTGMDDLRRDSALAGRIASALQTTFPTNVDRVPFDREVAAAIDIKNLKPRRRRKMAAHSR